jgi:Dioxygenases related to 2-nitropropane dioxygenase
MAFMLINIGMAGSDRYYKCGGNTMQLNAIKGFNIGDLTVKLPIIQGGMGVGVSLSGLASTVANEGRIGGIATAGIGMLNPDFGGDSLAANIRVLKQEIKKARKLTKGIIGVNIMTALSNFADMAWTAIKGRWQAGIWVLKRTR